MNPCPGFPLLLLALVTTGLAHAQPPAPPVTGPAADTAADLHAAPLPSKAARMAALREKCRDDPSFRLLISDLNRMTGHAGASENASLARLDHMAKSGTPGFDVFQAVQPRPAFLRTMQQGQRPHTASPSAVGP
jgi:hypothetical protein